MILGAERIKYFEMGPFTKDVTPFFEIFDPPPPMSPKVTFH